MFPGYVGDFLEAGENNHISFDISFFSALPGWCQCHPNKFDIAMICGESLQVTVTLRMIRCVMSHVNHTVDGRHLGGIS